MKKNLKDMTADTLIYLIESPEAHSDYSVDSLQAELNSRDLPDEDLKALIIQENEMIARMILEMDDISKAEVDMHQSHFLSKEELTEIYISQLEKYMRHKNGFRFDVWSYAIGGV